MQLTDTALDELERIWLEDHPGETISRERIREMGIRLTRMVEAVYLPDTPDDAPETLGTKDVRSVPSDEASCPNSRSELGPLAARRAQAATRRPSAGRRALGTPSDL